MLRETKTHPHTSHIHYLTTYLFLSFLQSGNARVSSKLSAYYGSSMLPPPPPPTAPMARPVTIIRSTEMGGSSGLGASPPASNTPPLSSSDSTGGARESRGGGQLSPTSQGNDSSSSSRSSFAVSRDYSLSHLHSQSSGQVHYVQTILHSYIHFFWRNTHRKKSFPFSPTLTFSQPTFGFLLTFSLTYVTMVVWWLKWEKGKFFFRFLVEEIVL